MDDNLEIEFADALQSIEQKRGLAALLQTSADQEQRLLDIARHERAEAKRYRLLYETEHAKNQALQSRCDELLRENEQLRNRPLSITTDKYIESFSIGQQLFTLQTTKRKSAKRIDFTDQLNLDLWSELPAISLSTDNT